MKKRIIALLLCTMVVVLFTGCASPIEKFKEKFGNGSGTSSKDPIQLTEDEASYVADWLGEIGPFEVGQEVTVDNLITIPEEYKDMVKQIVLLDETGGLIEKLDTSAPGNYAVTVVADIAGTSGYTTTLNYIVVEKSGPNLPDGLKSSLKENNWDKLDLAYTDASGKSASVSNVPGLVKLVSAFDAAANTDNIVWVTFIQTNDQELEQANAKTSVLRTPEYVIQLRNRSASIPAEQAVLKSNTDLLISTYESLYKLSTSDTQTVLYDTDGKSYIVKQAKVSYNGSATDSLIQCYYVNYDDKARLLFVPVVKDDPNSRLKTDIDNPGNIDLTRTQQPTKIEEYVKAKAGDVAFAPATNETIAKSFELFTNNILIGDFKKLNVSSSSTTGGGDVVIINDGSGYEAEGTAVAKKTYAQKYPFLYKYPESPDGNIYRPWIYMVTNSTTYLGSIWLGGQNKYLQNSESSSGSTAVIEDNPTITPSITPSQGSTTSSQGSTTPSQGSTTRNQGGTTPSQGSTTPSQGSTSPSHGSTTPSSTQPSQQSGSQETGNWSAKLSVVTDPNRYYTVTNNGNEKIKLDSAKTTNGSVVILYGDRTYVITTLRETQLNNILKNGGLYPNEEKNFMTGTFKTDPKGMNEGPGPDNRGTLALHDCFYKDKSGQDYYGSYCAVWKLNGDYIVCYADKIEQEGCAKLEMFLRSYVK